MKKIWFLTLVVMSVSEIWAQDRKVAVFDPAGSVDNTIKEIVREEISSAIVNTGSYKVFERKLINKALEENRFQSDSLMDDSQISEIGKYLGANLILVSNITLINDNNFHISFKLIDSQSAFIEKQQTAKTQNGFNELINVVQKMVREMFDSKENREIKPVMLVANKRMVLQDDRELDKYEVWQIMTNTDALQLYDKGLLRNRNGNLCLITGICLSAGGVFITAAKPFEWRYNYYEYDDLYYGYKDEKLNNVLGGSLMAAGVVMMITGVTLKTTSKTFIRQSVDSHNGQKTTSGVELKFDFTGNGVRLALRF